MSARNARVRLFLADDHLIVRDGIRTVLQGAGFEVIGEASDGRTAVSICDKLKPDVAILDIGMPLKNGIDAARDIRRLSARTKIILLTMYPEEPYVVEGLRAGVTGYVLKHNAASTLVQAIEAVSRQKLYLSPEVSQTLVEAYLSHVEAPSDPLSSREREVLHLIAEGKNMKEIGAALGISARTAETHRTRVMQKLDIHDVAGLVRYAMKHALISGLQPEDVVVLPVARPQNHDGRAVRSSHKTAPIMENLTA